MQPQMVSTSSRKTGHLPAKCQTATCSEGKLSSSLCRLRTATAVWVLSGGAFTNRPVFLWFSAKKGYPRKATRPYTYFYLLGSPLAELNMQDCTPIVRSLWKYSEYLNASLWETESITSSLQEPRWVLLPMFLVSRFMVVENYLLDRFTYPGDVFSNQTMVVDIGCHGRFV